MRASQNQVASEFVRLVVGVSGKEALRRHIQDAEDRTVNDDELDAEWLDLTKPGGPTIVPNPVIHIRLVVELVPGFGLS